MNPRGYQSAFLAGGIHVRPSLSCLPPRMSLCPLLVTLMTCYTVLVVAALLLSFVYFVTSHGNGIAVLDTVRAVALHALCFYAPCFVPLHISAT